MVFEEAGRRQKSRAEMNHRERQQHRRGDPIAVLVHRTGAQHWQRPPNRLSVGEREGMRFAHHAGRRAARTFRKLSPRSRIETDRLAPRSGNVAAIPTGLEVFPATLHAFFTNRACIFTPSSRRTGRIAFWKPAQEAVQRFPGQNSESARRFWWQLRRPQLRQLSADPLPTQVSTLGPPSLKGTQ